MRKQNLKVYSDSQPDISQINNIYEAHDSTIALYLAEVRQIIVNISTSSIEQILRNDNMAGNILSRPRIRKHPLPSRGIITKVLIQKRIHKD